MSMSRGKVVAALLVCKVEEVCVRSWRVDRDLGGFLITDFSDHNDVGS